MTRRILASLIAVMATLGLSLSVQAPAHAAKEKWILKKYDAGEIRNSSTFFVKAKIVDGKRQKVILQSARGKNGKYRNFKTVRANAKGKFYIKFRGRKGTCFKLVIPADKHHKKLTGKVGCIV